MFVLDLTVPSFHASTALKETTSFNAKVTKNLIHLNKLMRTAPNEDKRTEYQGLIADNEFLLECNKNMRRTIFEYVKDFWAFFTEMRQMTHA